MLSQLTVGSLDCRRRGVASDIDEPYNLHLAYRVFYWLLTFYPKLQKSSVNLGPTLDIDNLKDPEQFFLAFERLEEPTKTVNNVELGAPVAFPRKVEQ
ncbi:hypothetical protein Peur_002664 [Populus x canadensis]